jgi:protein O-mannosyl-transferase
VREAMAYFQKTLEIQPNNVDACHYLAWVLATCPEPSVRNGAKAVALAQEANQLSGGGDPEIISTLAAAYAEAGRFPEAVTTAQQALRLAINQTSTTTVDDLRTAIGLYQAGLPLRDLNLTNTLPAEIRP